MDCEQKEPVLTLKTLTHKTDSNPDTGTQRNWIFFLFLQAFEFDKVLHELVFHKVNRYYRIQGSVFNWVKDFLSKYWKCDATT